MGARASKLSFIVTLPESSAMAVVKLLKVEPISNVPFDMRFIQPCPGAFGRVVRVEIRHGGHGEDFARMHVQHDGAGGKRLVFAPWPPTTSRTMCCTR
jgi:hypothetical protein